jgi:NAD(P)H-nitrite reductase large subunit
MLLLKSSLNKMGPPKSKSRVVCDCLGITEAELVGAIRAEGLRTVKQVAACTDAGGGCTACHPAIREYLAREARAQAHQAAGQPAAPSPSPIFSAK